MSREKKRFKAKTAAEEIARIDSIAVLVEAIRKVRSLRALARIMKDKP